MKMLWPLVELMKFTIMEPVQLEKYFDDKGVDELKRRLKDVDLKCKEIY